MSQPAKLLRPDVVDLTLADQRVHGLPDLLPGTVAVHVVHLVEVDRLRAQPPQASFAVRRIFTDERLRPL